MKSIMSNIFLVLFAVTANTSVSYCQKKYPEEINYKMGLMEYAYDEVNISDGNEALDVWLETMKKRLLRQGVKKLDITHKSYDNLLKLENDVTSNKIDVFSLKATDFYKLKNTNNYVPLFGGIRSTYSRYEQFILITNKQTGYKSISDIAAEEIATAKTIYEDLSVLWVEVAIKENLGKKLKKPINFNSTSITESNLLLGVFFGKFKCAVVSLSVFELVCELNPKVKSNIIILSTSPNLINNFFAGKKNIPESTVEALELFASELHDDKEGKQILALFKVNKFQKLTIADIQETKELIQKHKLLFGTK